MHDQLRARIGTLESSIGESTTGAGPVDVESFRTSCLAFCRALRRHHIGEDHGAFPVLRRHNPALGAVLDDLVRDHAFLDPMLDRLELLAAEGAPDRTAAVEREVAGVAAVLDNHLAYEERTLISVLNALAIEPGSPTDEALRAPLDGIFHPADW